MYAEKVSLAVLFLKEEEAQQYSRISHFKVALKNTLQEAKLIVSVLLGVRFSYRTLHK